MRKLIPAIFLISLFANACTKSSGVAGVSDSEPPLIKIISPVNLPELHPGDQLNITANISDNRRLIAAAWEALKAAAVCGNNPYKGEFQISAKNFEMNISFTIPAGFSGERMMRLYAMDDSGNITTVDVPYKALN